VESKEEGVGIYGEGWWKKRRGERTGEKKNERLRW
jgi:hypothetical protein